MSRRAAWCDALAVERAAHRLAARGHDRDPDAPPPLPADLDALSLAQLGALIDAERRAGRWGRADTLSLRYARREADDAARAAGQPTHAEREALHAALAREWRTRDLAAATARRERRQQAHRAAWQRDHPRGLAAQPHPVP